MQKREHVAVGAPIAGDAPRENDENADGRPYWIHGHGPREHEVEIHEDAEKCGDAGEAAQDEPDPNGYFSERDEVRPKIRVRDEGLLQEIGVPPLHIRMARRRIRAEFGSLVKCASREAGDGRARIGPKPRGVLEFPPPCFEPLPTKPDARDEPERRTARVGGEKISERGRLNGPCHTAIVLPKNPRDADFWGEPRGGGNYHAK